ncbi:MAG: tyrosine-type recombinase/integrase [Oscillospiraceae bacterium]|nr:tyrosine-type recombinase/integrase [Oscillospiraceae bacterium]
MKSNIIDGNAVIRFEKWLIEDEKSEKTREKYLRDVRAFLVFLSDQPLCKELVILYKQQLIDKGYAVRSINSMLASVNRFLCFVGHVECKVKNLKVQREVYCSEKRELTKKEYMRLLNAAKSRPRLYLLLQTIAGTGIRVSELKYFTVEAVSRGEVRVSAKGKIRRILLPSKLKALLLNYAKRNGISTGVIFRTKNGNPLDRSNIWSEMKSLCKEAAVEEGKVFPHNLRKLFARTFYALEKDIAKLADILGHSRIDTTRIYIISTGIEHRKKIEKLGLVV